MNIDNMKEQDRNIHYNHCDKVIRSCKTQEQLNDARNIVDNFRKKAHFGYQQAIHKRKDRNGREAKTKDFLSKFNKKK